MNKVTLKHLSFIWLIILSIFSLYVFLNFDYFVQEYIYNTKDSFFYNCSVKKIGEVSLLSQNILFENVVYSSIFLFLCGYFYISRFFSANKFLISCSKFLFAYFILSCFFIYCSYHFDILSLGNDILNCFLNYIFFSFSKKYNFLFLFLVSVSTILIFVLKDKNISETKLNRYTVIGIFTYVIAILSVPSFLFVDYCLSYIYSRTIVSLPANNVLLKETQNINLEKLAKKEKIKFRKHLIYSMNNKNRWNIHVEDEKSKKSFDFEFMTNDKSDDVFIDIAKLDNHVVIACKEGIYYFDLNDIPTSGKIFHQSNFNRYLKDEYSLIPGSLELFYRNGKNLHIIYVAGKKNIYIDYYYLTNTGLEPKSVHVFNKEEKSKDYDVWLDSVNNPYLLYILTEDKNYIYNIHY